jgi:hypothetical protein
MTGASITDLLPSSIDAPSDMTPNVWNWFYSARYRRGLIANLLPRAIDTPANTTPNLRDRFYSAGDGRGLIANLLPSSVHAPADPAPNVWDRFYPARLSFDLRSNCTRQCENQNDDKSTHSRNPFFGRIARIVLLAICITRQKRGRLTSGGVINFTLPQLCRAVG